MAVPVPILAFLLNNKSSTSAGCIAVPESSQLLLLLPFTSLQMLFTEVPLLAAWTIIYFSLGNSKPGADWRCHCEDHFIGPG